MNGNGERGTAWLGYALQEGIKHGLTDAREMLAHATPEVLVAQLPRELTSQLIAGALKTGRLTPESVLEVAPPAVLAEHLESTVVWSCLRDAAEAANLTTVGGTASAAGQALDGRHPRARHRRRAHQRRRRGQARAAAEWVKDAPPAVLAEMLAHGLSKGAFDPKLALEHLTPEIMAENLSPPLVWKCIVDVRAEDVRPRRRRVAGVRYAREGGGVDVGGQARGDGRAPEPDRVAPARPTPTRGSRTPSPTTK